MPDILPSAGPLRFRPKRRTPYEYAVHSSQERMFIEKLGGKFIYAGIRKQLQQTLRPYRFFRTFQL